MRDSVISAKSLTKKYGDFCAVNGIDLEVPHGVCFGLLGPNGAGKTTMIQTIQASSPISEGRLSVLGKDTVHDSREIRKKIGGSIINMSSQLGRVGAPIRSVYNMTKFGLEGLTRGMALELGKYNIRVNSVCPTFVETPMVKAFFKDKKFKAQMIKNIPLGRVAQENDVSTAVAFLAADSSNSITGTSLMVDGGWTAQ